MVKRKYNVLCLKKLQTEKKKKKRHMNLFILYLYSVLELLQVTDTDT